MVSDWSSDVCSSDLRLKQSSPAEHFAVDRRSGRLTLESARHLFGGFGLKLDHRLARIKGQVRGEYHQSHRQGPQTTQVWVYFIFDKFMTIKRWLVFPTFSVDFVSPAGVYVATPFLRSPFSVFPSG